MYTIVGYYLKNYYADCYHLSPIEPPPIIGAVSIRKSSPLKILTENSKLKSLEAPALQLFGYKVLGLQGYWVWALKLWQALARGVSR